MLHAPSGVRQKVQMTIEGADTIGLPPGRQVKKPKLPCRDELGLEVLGLWRDFVLRLSSTPVASIAKIRGRTRGIGNEFVLACDMRFASRQSALFGNPEIGVGLVPGGGALEWLPRLVGRSRALEIVLSADDFQC